MAYLYVIPAPASPHLVFGMPAPEYPSWMSFLLIHLPLGAAATLVSMGIVVTRSGIVWPYNLHTVYLYTTVPCASITKPLCVPSSVGPGRRHRQDGRQLVQSSPPLTVFLFTPRWGYVGSWVKVIVHTGREVSAGACAVFHIISAVRKQRETNSGADSVLCLLFI